MASDKQQIYLHDLIGCKTFQFIYFRPIACTTYHTPGQLRRDPSNRRRCENAWIWNKCLTFNQKSRMFLREQGPIPTVLETMHGQPLRLDQTRVKLVIGKKTDIHSTRIIIIIIIIMNFYSPVSNTRCHSIGHKMRIARIKIRVDSPGRWERA